MSDHLLGDIVTFLRARIAEDYEIAADAPPSHSVSATAGVGANAEDNARISKHYSIWPPARVLYECDSKRRVIEALIPHVHEDAAGRALRGMTVVYQDHPDFRREWATDKP